MLMHPTQITLKCSKHIPKKKDHPPKGKKQAKKQKTEESLKHSLLYLSYTLMCGYLFAYFWICISPHFRNFPALRSLFSYIIII